MFLVKKLCVAFCISCLLTTAASAKTYWHFTFKAFNDPSDNSAVEWAWVTMVEMSKERAFPAEAATIQRHGGRLQGIIFAFVRGAAWRSDHSYTKKTRCKGRPAEKEIFWHASNSESVFAGGQINTDGSFQFSFTTRPILKANGTWFDPKGRGHAFVGPVSVDGEPAEEMKGGFTLYGVNYQDALEHHRRCGKAWAKQYKSDFSHFQHARIRETLDPGENSFFAQEFWGPHDSKTIVYDVRRSSSSKHPHWKRQEM